MRGFIMAGRAPRWLRYGTTAGILRGHDRVLVKMIGDEEDDIKKGGLPLVIPVEDLASGKKRIGTYNRRLTKYEQYVEVGQREYLFNLLQKAGVGLDRVPKLLKEMVTAEIIIRQNGKEVAREPDRATRNKALQIILSLSGVENTPAPRPAELHQHQHVHVENIENIPVVEPLKAVAVETQPTQATALERIMNRAGVTTRPLDDERIPGEIAPLLDNSYSDTSVRLPVVEADKHEE
jgi:hypothetical protein